MLIPIEMFDALGYKVTRKENRPSSKSLNNKFYSSAIDFRVHRTRTNKRKLVIVSTQPSCSLVFL